VLLALPPGLRGAVRDTATAGSRLRHGIGKVTFNGAITMRIRPPPDRLRSYYEEAARRFGVPGTLLAAINPDGSLSADAERLELADRRPRYRRRHGVALRFEQREGIAGGLRRIGGAAREPQHLRQIDERFALRVGVV